MSSANSYRLTLLCTMKYRFTVLTNYLYCQTTERRPIELQVIPCLFYPWWSCYPAVCLQSSLTPPPAGTTPRAVGASRYLGSMAQTNPHLKNKIYCNHYFRRSIPKHLLKSLQQIKMSVYYILLFSNTHLSHIH